MWSFGVMLLNTLTCQINWCINPATYRPTFCQDTTTSFLGMNSTRRTWVWAMHACKDKPQIRRNGLYWVLLTNTKLSWDGSRNTVLDLYVRLYWFNPELWNIQRRYIDVSETLRINCRHQHGIWISTDVDNQKLPLNISYCESHMAENMAVTIGK